MDIGEIIEVGDREIAAPQIKPSVEPAPEKETKVEREKEDA